MNLGGPKWQMPGWRIEQKYCTGVLIGNWSEDRLGKVSYCVYTCTCVYVLLSVDLIQPLKSYNLQHLDMFPTSQPVHYKVDSTSFISIY